MEQKTKYNLTRKREEILLVLFISQVLAEKKIKETKYLKKHHHTDRYKKEVERQHKAIRGNAFRIGTRLFLNNSYKIGDKLIVNDKLSRSKQESINRDLRYLEDKGLVEVIRHKPSKELFRFSLNEYKLTKASVPLVSNLLKEAMNKKVL